MNYDIKSVGNRIRRIRLSLGYSQAEFARKLDVSRAAYHNWEHGKHKPKPDNLSDIAFYGQISVEELLEGDTVRIKCADLFNDKLDLREHLVVMLNSEDSSEIAQEFDVTETVIDEILLRANIFVIQNRLYDVIEVPRYEGGN